ncbi:MAG: right-handed parallel beta-helix repeat-containing protein [Haloarculaceae archaeon]
MSRTSVIAAGVAALLATSLVVAGAPGGTALLSGTARASEPTEIGNCTTIDQPGTYVLTSDVRQNGSDAARNDTEHGVVYDPGSGSPCLNVTASDVVIRGQGHSLTGNARQPDSQYPEPIGTAPAGVRVHRGRSNVTVRNLTVRNFGTGVNYTGVSGGRIDDVRATQGTWGIVLDSTDGVTVADSNASDQYFGGGLSVVDAEGTHVVDSKFLRDQYQSIRGSSEASVRVLRSPGTVLSGDRIARGDTLAITASPGTVLRDNRITQLSSFDDGMVALDDSSGTRLLGNNVTGSNDLIAIGLDSKSVVVRQNDVAADGHRSRNWVEVHGPDARVANNSLTDVSVGVKAGGANVTVADNNFDGPERDPGVSIDGAADARVVGNDVATTYSGVVLRGRVDGATVAHNVVTGSDRGVALESSRGNVTITENELRGNDRAVLAERSDSSGGGSSSGQCDLGTEAVSLAVHDNVIEHSSAYAIDNELEQTIDATNNYWGAASGPSSANDPDAPFADPVTGEPADGTGGAVSEGSTAGVSNVHFDPFLTNASAAADG